MKTIPLFFNQENKIYQYVSSEGFVECDECGVHLSVGNQVFIRVSWVHKARVQKRNSKVEVLCGMCLVDSGVFSDVLEVKVATVSRFRHNSCSPVFILPPQLGGSGKNMDVFEAADRLRPPKVKDNTKYAGRESLEGATIGKPELIEELENKDAEDKKLVGDDELDALLGAELGLSLKAPDKDDDKKQLGDGSGS